jgi:hypothetical protein
MTERNYYKIFKEFIEEPLLKYFSHLDLNDWTDFFEDYYKHNLTFLLRILDTPKGEDIYSYGLIWVKDVDASTKELIARANDTLLSNFIQENDSVLLQEVFKAVRYLKLDVNKDLLIIVISNRDREQKVRELAALTLIAVHENSAISFWDNLDLSKDQFLIPSYIAFHRRNNPIKGLNKLSIIKSKPENISPFETPILYSLHQISNSISDTEKYKEIQKTFPSWVSSFINYLFESYPELSNFREKLQSPYEDILKTLGLDSHLLENETLPLELKHSLNLLLDKVKKKPDVVSKINQSEVSVIDPTYIQNIDSAIAKLKSKIRQLNIGNFNDPSNEQVFEATENKVYYKIPTLFLYPYFLDENRVSDNEAGVIPYAVQTSMAIIIHKRNEKYNDWVGIRLEAESELKQSDRNGKFSDEALDRYTSIDASTKWLKSLIEHLYKKNGEINSVRGYVFHSIIQQFADTHITDNKKMGEILKISTDTDNIKTKLPFYKTLAGHENLNPNQILLLDPADAFKVSQNGKRIFQNLNDDYDIINIKHGLKISVGIGFSLLALPRLLKNNNWKILQEFILQELERDKELLMGVGISLLELESKAVKQSNTIKV